LLLIAPLYRILSVIVAGYREDMIDLIGPRPFETADDLDRALGYGGKKEPEEGKGDEGVGKPGSGDLPAPGLAMKRTDVLL
jgi:hypothetical protein